MREEKLDKTLELTTSILAMRDLSALMNKIVDAVTDDFGFEACDLFLLNEQKDTFVLRSTKGFPQPISERVEGFSKSIKVVQDQLNEAERLGRFTYLYKAKPEENGAQYYSIMHPERAALPREHPDDWHELDVLYLTFEDAEGNVIGFMEPDSPFSGKLPSGTLITNLEIFASLASIALSNAELLGELDRSAKMYKTMLDTIAGLQEPGDLTATLQRISEKAYEFVPFDELSVYLTDWQKGLLVPAYATGPFASEVMADIGPMTGLAGSVAKSGKVEIVVDSIEDDRVEDIPGLEEFEVRQTMIAIPLKGKTGVVEGVLELYREKTHQFTNVEVTLVVPFATHAAIAIENAKLREELRRNFESVQKAYQEMKDLDRMKDSLVDTISHEMRTPLTTIMGYLEMASVGMYGDVPPKMKQKFDTMLDSVKRINQLVSTMLELSRLENKTLKLELEPVNLGMVTREVIREFEKDIAEKSHKISLLFGKDLPTVHADRLRTHDVIENLVSNAVKYTNPGGRIEIGADILDGKMHYFVKDNGIGISTEDHSKIFDRFFLADAGLTRADNRLGIGLHVSREIVRRHGGEMWFESSKGTGSTFHFTLPFRSRSGK
ncbi:MAG TPA: ATP-binding protein [Thermoplasmata archaeon]|nr:ATP-binding protein [Thermoplasmata archaeon]